jgi:hypothetical protein
MKEIAIPVKRIHKRLYSKLDCIVSVLQGHMEPCGHCYTLWEALQMTSEVINHLVHSTNSLYSTTASKAAKVGPGAVCLLLPTTCGHVRRAISAWSLRGRIVRRGHRRGTVLARRDTSVTPLETVLWPSQYVLLGTIGPSATWPFHYFHD